MALGLDEILIRMRLMGARQVASEATAAGSSIGAMGSRLEAAGKRMSTVGRSMTTGFTVPLALVGGAAIKMSLDFSHAMEQIHTQAGATQEEVHQLSGQVLEFASSGESTHGPKDLADALFHIESAGFRGAKAMQVLKASEALATTGASDMEGTTNALVGAMNSGIKGAGNMHQAIGTLNATVGAGNMRMEDLVGAMGTGLLTNAKQMGVTLPQVGAALATLTRQGQPAEASATRLSMAFRMMMSPTDQAASALNSIGLTTDRLGTMMQAGKFPQAVALLHEHLQSLGDSPAGLQKQASVIRDVFGARSSAGINAILQGLKTYDSSLGQINAKSSEFNKLHGAAQENVANQLKAAWAQVQAALIELGDTLIPVVVPAIMAVVGGIVALAHGFAHLPGPMRTAAIIFLLVLGIAGPILMFFGAMATAIAALIPVFTALDFVLSPWFLIAVAIIAVVAAFVLLYMKVKVFRDAVNAVFTFVKSHWLLLVSIFAGPFIFLAAFAISHFNQIKSIVVGVVNWIRGHWRLLVLILGGPFGAAVLIITHHFGAIKGFIAGVFSWIAHAASSIVGKIAGPFRTAAGAIGSAFNTVKGVVNSVIHILGAALQWLIDKVTALGDAVSSIPGSVWNKIPGHGIVDTATGGVGSAVGGAEDFLGLKAKGGTNLGPGWSWVGEEGPELRWTPGGSTIVPHGPSMAMAGSLGSVSSPQPIPSDVWNARMPTVVAKVFLRQRQIAEAVADEVADHKARK